MCRQNRTPGVLSRFILRRYTVNSHKLAETALGPMTMRSNLKLATSAALTLLWDTRFSLVTVVLAGFGRAAAEVGAVIIVGGNIDGVTRVMTTAIALETSKGDLPLALGLGMVLLGIIIGLNLLAHWVKLGAQRYHG